MSSFDAPRQLKTLVIEANSPDGAQRLTIASGPTVALTISSWSYGSYVKTGELERQLETVLCIGFTAWADARRRILAQARAARRSRPTSDTRSRMDEAAARVRVSAASPGGWIRLSTHGTTQWTVEVASNTLIHLSCAEFTNEVDQAVARVLTGHNKAMGRLRAELLG